MASVTLCCLATSAAWRSTSAPCVFSSSVGPVPEKTAERRVVRAAQVLAAERGGHLDGPLDAVEALLADGRRRG